MKKLALLVFLCSCILQMNQAAMNEKQVKSATKLMRNACQPKIKVSDELIENMHKGVWDNDPLPKCYMHCCMVMMKINCLARALFDNVAEAPDELAFCKGDVLVVLEQNTANIEGWWLCSLRGRQGICPGNRLRLIPGVYEDSGGSRGPSPQFPGDDLHILQRQGKRRSWHVQPNKVLTPRKFNDVYLYDMPPIRCSPIPVHSLSPSQNSQTSDYYDVPPKAIPVSDSSRSSCPRCSPAPSCVSPFSKDSSQDSSYDVPRPSYLLHSQNMLTPSSSASSLSMAGDSFSSSNRSSLINMPDYDVPRSHPAAAKGPQLLLQQQQQHYDVPHHQTHNHHQTIKELPLELSFALDTLQRLQSETTNVISRLLGFVTPKWRSVEKLEANVMEIKLAVIRLKTSLHDFSEFCEGALGNATRATDKNLAGKLVTLVISLKNSDKLIGDAADNLNHHNWAVSILARTEDEDNKYKPDELEQIIACARALTEDIRQAASFIQGNSSLLFKKDTTVQNNNDHHHHPEDYDYVNLDGKETKGDSPKVSRKNYGDEKRKDEEMDPQDKQLLTFFAIQTTTHHNNLTQAIDAFLLTIEHNQPPKTFLAHGKFVVLSAHKLVHIGDSVSRNISKEDIKVRALNCANALSEALATSVGKTKQAALQFPSVTAVQDMVDSIVDISHLAKDLKCCLVQAAAAQS